MFGGEAAEPSPNQTLLSSSRNKVAVGELVAWWRRRSRAATKQPLLQQLPYVHMK